MVCSIICIVLTTSFISLHISFIIVVFCSSSNSAIVRISPVGSEETFACFLALFFLICFGGISTLPSTSANASRGRFPDVMGVGCTAAVVSSGCTPAVVSSDCCTAVVSSGCCTVVVNSAKKWSGMSSRPSRKSFSISSITFFGPVYKCIVGKHSYVCTKSVRLSRIYSQ